MISTFFGNFSLNRRKNSGFVRSVCSDPAESAQIFPCAHAFSGTTVSLGRLFSRILSFSGGKTCCNIVKYAWTGTCSAPAEYPAFEGGAAVFGLFLRVLVSVLGIALAVWCLGGWMLLCVRRSCWTVFFLSGQEPQLEQQVRAFAFLRGSGLLHGSLLLVDCGLDECARIRAEALGAQHGYVELWSREAFLQWQQECTSWSRIPS